MDEGVDLSRNGLTHLRWDLGYKFVEGIDRSFKTNSIEVIDFPEQEKELYQHLACDASFKIRDDHVESFTHEGCAKVQT